MAKRIFEFTSNVRYNGKKYTIGQKVALTDKEAKKLKRFVKEVKEEKTEGKNEGK